MTSQPAGWYPDGSGAQRYWDGTQWTEHTAPLSEVQVTEEVVTEESYAPPTTTHAAHAAPAEVAHDFPTRASLASGAVTTQHNAVATSAPYPHAANLDTNRSLVKFILIGLITFNIYPIYLTARAGEDLNLIASRWDNKRTMNYWLIALLLGPITLGVMIFVWWHGFSNRIGDEQRRRGLPVTVTAKEFWLWNVLGILIIVGPFIFAHKWLTAMNELCASYNAGQ